MMIITIIIIIIIIIVITNSNINTSNNNNDNNNNDNKQSIICKNKQLRPGPREWPAEENSAPRRKSFPPWKDIYIYIHIRISISTIIIHSYLARRGRRCGTGLGAHHRGVQSEGGAVDEVALYNKTTYNIM